MEKKNKKPLVFIALLFSVLLIVGGTIAYYTSSDTFENEFDTGTYKIETQEAFVSPDNWTPGTTTEKTIIATNKGNTMAAVRIKLEESWKDENGGSLPLLKEGVPAAIINFSPDKDVKWIYQDGYYYYVRPLDENESTTSLLESVTFNPDLDISVNSNCTTDSVAGTKTCTTETTGYAGGKYTLQIEVETAQYDKYKEIWNTNVDINRPNTQVDGYLLYNGSDNSKTFNKNIARDSFEKLIITDIINIPQNAIDSWDVSYHHNNSIKAWYTDTDNNGLYELFIGQEGGVKANPNSNYAFSNFKKVKYADFTYLNTSNTTNMENAFDSIGYNATSLRINGLDKLDTSQVTSFHYAFDAVGFNCQDVYIGNLSNWNLDSATDMSNMFYYGAFYSQNTYLDVSGWDTGNVRDMSHMFHRFGYYTPIFSFDLSNWDTGNVTYMEEMFYESGYSSTTWSVGDLSDWDLSKVTTTFRMFYSAGYSATSVADIGTLDIYSNTIRGMFCGFKAGKAIINIHNNPTDYSSVFSSASTVSGSLITVNYSSTTTNIDSIIATKSSNSNVVKGVQLD